MVQIWKSSSGKCGGGGIKKRDVNERDLSNTYHRALCQESLNKDQVQDLRTGTWHIPWANGRKPPLGSSNAVNTLPGCRESIHCKIRN